MSKSLSRSHAFPFELALDSMNSKALESAAVSREELIQVLAKSPFARIYNFALHSFASGECTLIVSV